MAFLSPCSFPLLPAYVSYYLGLEEAPAKGLEISRVLRRGVLGGLACAVGAILVLTLIGAAVSVFGGAVALYIPALGLVVGVLLVILGVLMLFGPPVSFRVRVKVGTRKGYLGLLGFGVIYALGSAGCVAPVFIGVVSIATLSGLLGGVVIFLSYAFGLSLLLIVTTMMVAGAKELAIARLMRAMPYVKQAGGLVMIVVGVYLATAYVLAS
jgi:cytochrome c-type biogenesis protein